MEIHVGQAIKKKAREKDIKATELASLLKTTPQNISALFNRKSIDADQLLHISIALDFNFFTLYDNGYRAAKGEQSDFTDGGQVQIAEVIEKQKQKIEGLEKSNSTLQKTNDALILAIEAFESIGKNYKEREAELLKRIDNLEKKK